MSTCFWQGMGKRASHIQSNRYLKGVRIFMYLENIEFIEAIVSEFQRKFR